MAKAQTLAQVGNQTIKDDEELIKKAEASFRDEEDNDPIIRRRANDPVMNAVGLNFCVSNRYEDWYKDVYGNRIRFDRYFPAQKLYIDLFEEVVEKEVIDKRKKIVEDHKCKYLPVNYGESLMRRGNQLVSFKMVNKEQKVMAVVNFTIGEEEKPAKPNPKEE